MSDWHVNLFRPYENSGRDEMSVTRAFVLACLKAKYGKEFLQKVFISSGIADASPAALQEMKGELEVPADKIKGLTGGEPQTAHILCIAQDKGFSPSEWDDIWEAFKHQKAKENFSRVVSKNGEPNLQKFEESLKNLCSNVTEVYAKDELKRENILQGAYWDVWRILYSGARPDALFWGDGFVCLIESKIWGNVSKVQAQNHARSAFEASIGEKSISWQEVHDIAANVLKENGQDPILNDFKSFLQDYPHLVRWNGFDEEDLRAFDLADLGFDENDNDSELLWDRLCARYYQCMEDLVKKFKYTLLANRGTDWDFNPSDCNFLGNTGIGFWEMGQIATKWCIGQHAAEMDELMSRCDFQERGLEALCMMIDDIFVAKIPGVSIEFRAVQRFQFANASDNTGFDGTPTAIDVICGKKDQVTDAVLTVWREETNWLQDFHKRRGQVISAAEALELKKEIIRKRQPQRNDIEEIGMATAHSTWRLFAAFNTFLWLDPKRFFTDDSDQMLPKDIQLERLHKMVDISARFAEKVSGTPA